MLPGSLCIPFQLVTQSLIYPPHPFSAPQWVSCPCLQAQPPHSKPQAATTALSLKWECDFGPQEEPFTALQEKRLQQSIQELRVCHSPTCPDSSASSPHSLALQLSLCASTLLCTHGSLAPGAFSLAQRSSHTRELSHFQSLSFTNYFPNKPAELLTLDCSSGLVSPTLNCELPQYMDCAVSFTSLFNTYLLSTVTFQALEMYQQTKQRNPCSR